MSILDIAAVLAVVVYVIGRQLIGEHLRGRRLIVLPLVLAAIGVSQLVGHGHHARPADVALIAASAVVAACIGMVQGSRMRLEARDGTLWGQMPLRSLWLWIALVGSRLVFDLIAHGVGAHLAASAAPIILTLGINRLAQAAVVTPRALAAGIPFAPEKNGSTFLAGALATPLDGGSNARTSAAARRRYCDDEGQRPPHRPSHARRSTSSTMMTTTRAMESGQPQPERHLSLHALNWTARVLATAIIGFIALESHTDHRAPIVASLAAATLLLIGWAGIDRAEVQGRQVPVVVMTLVLGGIGIAGGLVAALSVGNSLVAFAIMAAIGAGGDLPTGPAIGVAASSILAIEVSALIFGFDSGELGWPMAVIAGLLVGRNRRDAREKSEQALALMAQAEQTRTEQQRAATLDERSRIAREIHDLLAHSLGALGIQLEAAEALLTDAHDIDSALPLLHRARLLAASGLEETRSAIDALRTDTPPLPETLRTLAESHLEQYQTATELTVTGVARALKPDTNLALIRITREALANSAKHAPLAPITIDLAYGNAETTVTVSNTSTTDDHEPGDATTKLTGPAGGYGLAGMRERLLLIGGTLSAGQSETGWTVRARVPS